MRLFKDWSKIVGNSHNWPIGDLRCECERVAVYWMNIHFSANFFLTDLKLEMRNSRTRSECCNFSCWTWEAKGHWENTYISNSFTCGLPTKTLSGREHWNHLCNSSMRGQRDGAALLLTNVIKIFPLRLPIPVYFCVKLLEDWTVCYLTKTPAVWGAVDFKPTWPSDWNCTASCSSFSSLCVIHRSNPSERTEHHPEGYCLALCHHLALHAANGSGSKIAKNSFLFPVDSYYDNYSSYKCN